MKTPVLKTLVAVVATVSALGLSGCSLIADITTSTPYDASDGLGVTVAGVSAQNLLVVSPGKGEPSVVVGSLTNSGTSDAVVQFQTATGNPEVTVPAGTTVRLGIGEGQELVIIVPEAMPGLMERLRVSVAGADASRLDVPVVDGTLPEYLALLEAIPSA